MVFSSIALLPVLWLSSLLYPCASKGTINKFESKLFRREIFRLFFCRPGRFLGRGDVVLLKLSLLLLVDNMLDFSSVVILPLSSPLRPFGKKPERSIESKLLRREYFELTFGRLERLIDRGDVVMLKVSLLLLGDNMTNFSSRALPLLLLLSSPLLPFGNKPERSKLLRRKYFELTFGRPEPLLDRGDIIWASTSLSKLLFGDVMVNISPIVLLPTDVFLPSDNAGGTFVSLVAPSMIALLMLFFQFEPVFDRSIRHEKNALKFRYRVVQK